MSDRADPSAPVVSRVDAVVFDVGRVLVQWDLRVLFAQVLDDPDEIAWVYAHAVTEAWHGQVDRGRALADMVAERRALFPQYAPVIEAYATRFPQSIPGPVPGTAELVEALAARGMPLYAITNFGAEFWDQFSPDWPVLDHFHDIVVSGREKLAKPDPAIYRLAARRFGHAPERMLFIDDNGDNIAAARALGWQGHHFRDAPTLGEDLRARGLI